MELGMLGLGRMGTNMVRRLLRVGHQCVVYDIHPGPIQLSSKGSGIEGRLCSRCRNIGNENHYPIAREIETTMGVRAVWPEG